MVLKDFIMKRGFAWLGMILFVSATSMAWNGVQPAKPILKDLEKSFGTDLLIQIIQFSDGDLSAIPDWKGGDKVYTIRGEGGRSGFLLSTCSKGRYDLFDYSVVYSDTLSVLAVRVTAYRSSHGGAICSKGWLKQFQGYKGEKIELGKDIDSISGATVSATSLVADMQRCHRIMKIIENKGLLH